MRARSCCLFRCLEWGAMLLLLLLWRAVAKPAEGMSFGALLPLAVLEPAEGFAMSSLVAFAPALRIEPAQGFCLGAAVSRCGRVCARLWHPDWGACVVHSDVRACARLGLVADSRVPGPLLLCLPISSAWRCSSRTSQRWACTSAGCRPVTAGTMCLSTQPGGIGRASNGMCLATGQTCGPITMHAEEVSLETFWPAVRQKLRATAEAEWGQGWWPAPEAPGGARLCTGEGARRMAALLGTGSGKACARQWRSALIGSLRDTRVSLAGAPCRTSSPGAGGPACAAAPAGRAHRWMHRLEAADVAAAAEAAGECP